MTSFHDALANVAKQLNLDANQLISFASEDKLLGFYDGGDKYSIPYKNDGKFLYALIRALKPRNVLEIGTRYGGSARHICEALSKNKQGQLVTIDIEHYELDGISQALKNKTHLLQIHDDAEEWIKFRIVTGVQFDFDFIHEDGSHSIHLVHAIYHMLPSLMPNGGIIVSHDVGTGVGGDIMQGIQNAGFDPPPIYIYDGSPCGFSVMKYEGDKHE